MQLIWVSGPVGHIRRINLTARSLLMVAAAVGLVFILLGVCLEIAGFRFAIEYDPKLVHRMGNFYSAEEFTNLKQNYEGQISKIEEDLATFHDRLKDLDALNKKLKLIATPPPLITQKPMSNAMGGPLITLSPKQDANLASNFDDLRENSNQLLKYADASINYWKSELVWLESKPILFPLQGDIAISSRYGARIDPIVNKSSFHPGLDFQGAVGTDVFSTASGIVEFSGWDAGYGNCIIINHGDGYQTRYAHLSRLFVKAGDIVDQHERIGYLGSTGRSTGPHLHYEIIKDGHTIDPETMLLQLAHR